MNITNERKFLSRIYIKLKQFRERTRTLKACTEGSDPNIHLHSRISRVGAVRRRDVWRRRPCPRTLPARKAFVYWQTKHDLCIFCILDDRRSAFEIYSPDCKTPSWISSPYHGRGAARTGTCARYLRGAAHLMCKFPVMVSVNIGFGFSTFG